MQCAPCRMLIAPRHWYSERGGNMRAGAFVTILALAFGAAPALGDVSYLKPDGAIARLVRAGANIRDGVEIDACHAGADA